MDCPHHEHVENVVARMERHCNGTHVQQHHIDSLRRDVDAVMKNLETLCQTVTEMQKNEAVERASGTRHMQVVLGLMIFAGTVIQSLVNYLIK